MAPVAVGQRPWLRVRQFCWLATLCSSVACKDLGKDRAAEPSSELRPLPQPQKPVGTRGPSLFEPGPLQQAVRQLKRAVTGGKQGLKVSALELRALPTELLLQAEDPRAPGRVLLWKYSGGKVQEPLPVELKGAGALEDNLFSLDGVYLKAIPRLSALAVDHVDPQDGSVSLIVIRRNLPFSTDVRFRVFVNSPRQNGQLDANRFGHPLLG